MANSYATKPKPCKPYPEYPLFPHNNGQWCRKIAGKLHSFGSWDDPTGALKRHNDEYSFLKEGIEPPDSFEGWRVGELLDEFLAVLSDRLALNEIGKEHYDATKYCASLVLKHIPKNRAVESLKPADFRTLKNDMVKRLAPTNTRANMTRIRSFFKFAYEEQLIEKPVFYGRGFESPTKATLRKARNAKPKKLFTADQIHLLLDNATPSLKAMILLSINTGMNNADVGNMMERHVDLKTGWMDYPRHKTGIERVAKLWPETVKAIKAYLEIRQRPLNEFSDFLFITTARRKWGHSSLPTEFRKLRNNINTDDDGDELDPEPIPHGTFGYFRHTFETIAGGTRDQVAVNAVMGHVDSSMAAEYREDIENERLEAVAKHVRKWLFGKRVAK